ncbi:copper chaperone PCu(A)C [Luteimonas sp BLCC-B24]|uniref:copper chaperone PCu(A)C n=1 Tax=Luteimonas sp. BLCC-B24 TaxID=3025317 RepID=UPI00234E0A1F|nr:copper chaperone PCu(A)C [Luteimonas sp. BLCC-B24]MDC7805458.1 copper chaperone PCu(A)C [Luteimonas sp. BLCC-B24]
MSRSTLFAAGCLAAIALAGCQPASEGAATPASSADPAAASSTGAAQGVQVSDAWIRETPPNAAVAGGYLTLRSDAGDRLVAVETSASASVEIHEMSHAGGVMRMRELADGVELPAGTDVSLRPGGNHLMFIGPVEPVRAGQTIEATLRFQNAPEQTVQFEVRPLAGDAPAAGGHSGH